MKGPLVRLLHKLGFEYSGEDKASATQVWKKERVTVHVRPGSFTIDNSNNIFQVGTSLNELKEKVLAYLPELAYQLVPVEAYGVKGVQSKQWRKTFPSAEALSKWAEANDAEVLGQREA